MMKTMKPGSQLYRLMCLLSVAGEYPVKSLHLLGNKRMYRKLVKGAVAADGAERRDGRNTIAPETIQSLRQRQTQNHSPLCRGSPHTHLVR